MAGEQSASRRRAMRVAAALLLVVVGVLLYNRIWGDDNGGDNRPPRADGDQTPVEAAVDDVTTTLAEPGSAVDPTCPAADGSSPRQLRFSAPPPMCIDPAIEYIALVETTRGDFEITLNAPAAPVTVNNFVFLARWHYYDGVGFHRVIPGFVVQAGDPFTGEQSTGGPGYTIPDELPGGEAPFYPLMSMVMANSGAPDSGGGQFFIVTGPEGEQLPPTFSRFGSVTAGSPVVEDIDATGADDRTGRPEELTVIERITVVESEL
jgi:cyclophilin family peptidyl-prolyl cis-trans isomerase